MLDRAAAETVARYDLGIDSALAHIAVETCFERVLPTVLTARNALAVALMRHPRVTVDGRQLRLPLAQALCVRYDVDLSALASSDYHGVFERHGPSIVIDPDLLLWRDNRFAEKALFEIGVVVPAGYGVSTPGNLHRVDQTHFVTRLESGPAQWDARFAFGSMESEDLLIGTTRAQVTILATAAPIDFRGLRQWFASGAAAVSMLYGRLPIPAPQVLIVPVPANPEPVPWGYASLGLSVSGDQLGFSDDPEARRMRAAIMHAPAF